MGTRHANGGAAAIALAAGALVALGGCSPALDWREMRLEGGGVSMLFPCRPQSHERAVSLARQTLRMRMYACRAADTTFSLGVVDVTSPGDVTPTLAAWRQATAANVAAGSPEHQPFGAAGLTPNPESVRIRHDGRLPDGRPVSLRAAFFVKGLRLYQASVIGKVVTDNASETFFEGIRSAS